MTVLLNEFLIIRVDCSQRGRTWIRHERVFSHLLGSRLRVLIALTLRIITVSFRIVLLWICEAFFLLLNLRLFRMLFWIFAHLLLGLSLERSGVVRWLRLVQGGLLGKLPLDTLFIAWDNKIALRLLGGAIILLLRTVFLVHHDTGVIILANSVWLGWWFSMVAPAWAVLADPRVLFLSAGAFDLWNHFHLRSFVSFWSSSGRSGVRVLASSRFLLFVVRCWILTWTTVVFHIWSKIPIIFD